MRVERIAKSSLGPLTPLSKGGLGQVYRVGVITCPVTRPTWPTRNSPRTSRSRLIRPRTAGEFRDGLAPAGQADLDRTPRGRGRW